MNRLSVWEKGEKIAKKRSRRWMTLPYIMINQTVNFFWPKVFFVFHYFRFFLTRFSFNHQKKVKKMLLSFSDKECSLNNRFDLLSYRLIQWMRDIMRIALSTTWPIEQNGRAKNQKFASYQDVFQLKVSVNNPLYVMNVR